jgi:hypothetical protein
VCVNQFTLVLPASATNSSALDRAPVRRTAAPSDERLYWLAVKFAEPRPFVEDFARGLGLWALTILAGAVLLPILHPYFDRWRILETALTTGIMYPLFHAFGMERRGFAIMFGSMVILAPLFTAAFGR